MKPVKSDPKRPQKKRDLEKERKAREAEQAAYKLFKEAKRRADLKKTREGEQEAYKKLKAKKQRDEYLKSNPQAGRVSPAQRAAGFNK
jgi:hypothetical protein